MVLRHGCEGAHLFKSVWTYERIEWMLRNDVFVYKLDWRDLNVVLGHLSPFPIANRGFSSLGWMHWTELFNDSINLETFQCTFYFFLMVISHEWRRLV